MQLSTNKDPPVGQRQSLGRCIPSLDWPGEMHINCVIWVFACEHHHHLLEYNLICVISLNPAWLHGYSSAIVKMMLLSTNKDRPVGQRQSLGRCIPSLDWPGEMHINCVICVFGCEHHHHWVQYSLIYIIWFSRSSWLCLDASSTTRFTSHLGYRMGKNWIALYKEDAFYEQWHEIP